MYRSGFAYEKDRIGEGFMNIYLIRHGRQNSTCCNVNVPLSEAGKEQATLLANRLEAYEIDGVYSSDLIRAVETATIIREHLEKKQGKKLMSGIEKDLREADFGEMEGIENKEVKVIYKKFYEERKQLKQDMAYPKGECGQDVFDRAFPTLMKLTQIGCNNLVIVTHGGTIRSLLAGILGMSQARQPLLGTSLENCSITSLIYREKENRFYVEGFNDYAHLETNRELLRKNW